jgi:transposase
MENLITIGIDMGDSLWATTVTDWERGKSSYYGLRDEPGGRLKEEALYRKITEYVAAGKKVHCFYEAGRYGFTPARKMTGLGAEVTVLPVSKLEILSNGKKIKTDRTDSRFLAGLHPLDPLPRVYVPDKDEESRRSAESERKRLGVAIGRLNNQLLAIFKRSEIRGPAKHLTAAAWTEELTSLKKQGKTDLLPKFDRIRLAALVEELALAERHAKRWEELVKKDVEAERAAAAARGEETAVDRLMRLKGIGEETARALLWWIGDFGRFKNGRHFSSYFGLTPCPFASGKMTRDQGISKAGRGGLRAAALELAWRWTWWQKESRLTKKWAERLKERGRSRKTAIVALARQLVVALWRYMTRGEIPEGAVMRDAPAK